MPQDKTNSHGQPSLDEIVTQSATDVAHQIQKAAAWAKSEMDLQVEAAGALKGFAREAKITLEGHHNVTVATGRPDSVYGSVIVEYKDPGTLSPNKDAAPNKAVIEQLKRRFYDVNREEHRNWNSMFGVGTDGKYFIFLRFRDDKWTDQEPLEVNRYSTERFLWALYNLGQKGKPYQPEYLHGDFGSESEVAREGVLTLYEEILKTDNPKAQVFFNQWKILFGEVCGYDVENLTDKLKKLAESYAVKGKPQPAPLLFAVHTYYAILIKLLAADVVSFFYSKFLPRQVERLINATTPAKLKRELEELEQGGIFHTMGITNFLEGDLFAWYLAIWSDPIEKLVRKMISKLDEYNPGTFSEEPAQSRDLLKKLYQQLFPKSVRHDLGEYYTPDWLAEHVLNELGYEGDPDKRLLDPACGSGTFLVMAINRIRRWYDTNRERCAYDEGELLKKILANVIGFDLNPLAVMAARTNYLVAIKDLIRHVDQVEIPVYLCDSIMTPAEYGDLFTGHGNVAKVPCSAMKPPHLLVPKEIAKSPREVAKYAELLETCVKNAYAPGEFLSRCRDEGLNITATDAHVDLYKELVKLDKANKNGIWARIIKNNFAPLFVGRVDYVAGNPPWVSWESLVEEYRNDTKDLWRKFGFFTQKGYRAVVPAGKLELAALFVFVCADAYLRDRAQLGFVITQTVFKTRGAGEGFRKFILPSGVKLNVKRVYDLVELKPFESAQNRTSTFVIEKGTDTKYPVKYILWVPTPKYIHLRKIEGFEPSLNEVLAATKRISLGAAPVDSSKPESPWMTGPAPLLSAIRKVLGPSVYRAREGVNTEGANAVYWLDVIKDKAGKSIVQNHIEGAKKKVPRIPPTPIESDLIYPLLRGRDVSHWVANPSLSIIVTHPPRTPKHPIDEKLFKARYPKAFAYLKSFESDLAQRVLVRKLNWTWYALGKIGDYTFAPFKVVWREQAHEFTVAVIGTAKNGVEEKVVIPDHKLMSVSTSSLEEAHYICALLGSAPARAVVSGYSLSTQISTHVLEHIAVPVYSDVKPLHRSLSALSAKCHAKSENGDTDEVALVETEIDKAAAKLWGITDDELEVIQQSLADTRRSKRPKAGEKDD